MKDRIVLKSLVNVYKETYPKHRYEDDIKRSYNDNKETIAVKPGERHVFVTDGMLSEHGAAEFLKEYGGIVKTYTEGGMTYAVITNLNNKGYIRVYFGMEIGVK